MDNLKAVISSTLDASECTFYDQDAFDNAVDELAAAVRSFMGAHEVVERAAIALFGEEWSAVEPHAFDTELPEVQKYWRTSARTALSAAIGGTNAKP